MAKVCAMEEDLIEKYCGVEARRARFDRDRKRGKWMGKTVHRVINNQLGSELDRGEVEIHFPGSCDLTTQVDLDQGPRWRSDLPKSTRTGEGLDNMLRSYVDGQGSKVFSVLAGKKGGLVGRGVPSPAREFTIYRIPAVKLESSTQELDHEASQDTHLKGYIFGPVGHDECSFQNRRQEGGSRADNDAHHPPTKSGGSRDDFSSFWDYYFLQEGESLEKFVARRRFKAATTSALHTRLSSQNAIVERSSAEARERGEMLLGSLMSSKGKASGHVARRKSLAPWCFNETDYYDAKLDNSNKGFLDIDLGENCRVAHIGTQGQFPPVKDWSRSTKEKRRSSYKKFAQKNDSVQFRVITPDAAWSEDYGNWVTSYNLFARREKRQAVEGKSDWFLVGSFKGNTDMFTEVSHELPMPIEVRYLRIQPTTFNGHPRMRVAAYGKKVQQEVEEHQSKKNSVADVKDGMVDYVVQRRAANGPRTTYNLPRGDGCGGYRCPCCFYPCYHAALQEAKKKIRSDVKDGLTAPRSARAATEEYQRDLSLDPCGRPGILDDTYKDSRPQSDEDRVLFSSSCGASEPGTTEHHYWQGATIADYVAKALADGPSAKKRKKRKMQKAPSLSLSWNVLQERGTSGATERSWVNVGKEPGDDHDSDAGSWEKVSMP